jgi:predicted nucleotidyltransferase
MRLPADDSSIIVCNLCARDKVAAAYEPLIAGAIHVYRGLWGEAVHNIRLMGSVARGQAVAPYSDIDFIALLRGTPDATRLQEPSCFETALQYTYPVVARVDLEAIPAQGLHEFRRFVFATDSLSIYGTDDYTRRHVRMSRHKLAKLVTPDGAIVSDYRNTVARCDDQMRLRFYSRVVGKDVLKLWRALALLSGGTYERTPTAIYQQLAGLVPERAELLRELHDLYLNPTGDKQRLLRVLDKVEATDAG